MTKQLRFILLPAALLIGAGQVAAQQPSEEDELALAYGDKSFVSIATGSQQAISRAPSTATVITAGDIEAMGATDLDQALASVPGLHVSVSPIAYNPIYSFRGIHTGYNPQVLMLVNGLPITAIFGGHRSFAWGGMPLENVARIEVIRGPGSALYGADAYSGVINIITKTASDINGTEYGVRLGSFKTRDAFVQYGGKLGPVQAALYLRAGHTDGHKRIILKDAQSGLDELFGTHASLAPGPVNLVRDSVDARADFAYGDWRLRLALQQRDIGIGAGLAESLDARGRSPETRLYSDLTYQKVNWAPHWDVSAVLGFYQMKERPGDPAYTLFPAGAFGGAFPNGVIGNPGHFERHSNLALSAFYTGFDKHRVRVGTGYRVEDLYATPEYKNFSLVVVPGLGPTFVPLPALVESSGNPALTYAQPHKRTLTYAFVQDEWSLAQDWTLTAGLRQDSYNDFGATTNPRLALVWDAAYNVVVKAMHGRAFRAPSFVEQRTLNNPVNTGNPDIQPEKMSMSELALAWQFASGLQSSLNLYRYRMSDVIVLTPNPDPSTGKTFRNAGDQTGNGIELEAAWDVNRSLRLSASYALQHSTDEATGKAVGLAPQRRIFARADWRLGPSWQFGSTVNHVADRKRAALDLRAPIANYTTVDLPLQRDKFAGAWQLRTSVTNLFNADAREPSAAPGNIPFDLPLAGRAISVQLLHKL